MTPCFPLAKGVDIKVKKNIMVFPCGSEIGLEVYRALGKAKEVVLFGASSVSDHGEFVYENYISGLPFVSDNRFIDEINRIIKQYNIDYIVPAHDMVVRVLAEAVNQGKLSCTVLTSPYQTCVVCCSKRLTNELFSGKMIVPQLYDDLNSVADWPVFLKPDVGCGSRGTAIAFNREEAEFYIARTDKLLIFEYLPGKEFTVDCFTDRHGVLRFSGARERVRISNGISVRTVPAENEKLSALAEIINRTLVFRGMWFFQVKEDKNGQLALMEIAPRVAGAMGLYRDLGVNFALLSIYDAEGYDVDVIKNDIPLVFDRALESRFKMKIQYDHVYLDYDDCLIINDKVNLQMIAFLHHCLNRGVGVSLLTRHVGDLEASLQKHRLQFLFDDVIKVQDSIHKYEYITKANAIFIDDSFAERYDVKKTKHIAVFAPDTVEALMG